MAERVLLLAPHPDDEMLSAAGLLAGEVKAGGRARIIFLTNGERNHIRHILWKKHPFIGPDAIRRYGEVRKAEAECAARGLGGAESEFWNYTDTGLFARLAEGGERDAAALARAIAEFRPTLLIRPSCHDVHPDHSAAALLAEFAEARLGRPAFRTLRYIYHHGSGRRPALPEHVRMLTPAEAGLKLKLLNNYRSQMTGRRRTWLRFAGKDERFILDDDGVPAAFSLKYSGRGLAWTGPFGRFSVLGGSEIYLLGAGRTGVKRSYRVSLKPGGTASLRRYVGESWRAVSRVSYFSDGSGGLARLPAGLFTDCDQVYVKCKRPLAFFDETGFSRLSLN